MRGISTRVVLTVVAVGMVAASVSATAAGHPSEAQHAAAASRDTIWTVVGSSAQCFTTPVCRDDGPAGGARLTLPEAVAIGPKGTIYIADSGNNTVRRVGPGGTISRVAGLGTTCQSPPQCGSGKADEAELTFPSGVAVDGAGNVYIADTGDNEIRKVTPQGNISRVAGTGAPCAAPPKCGDGGAATSARLTGPTGLALNRAGDLLIADTGDQEIRELLPTGKITRVAGDGHLCRKPPACGDVGPPRSANLSFPQAVAVGKGGVLYIADEGDHEIRQISGGTITTFAGDGTRCLKPPGCGNGGAAVSAQLNYPDGVAATRSGHVFIADTGDNEIREVVGGKISRVAGKGKPCSTLPGCGDSHQASAATLNYPNAVAVDKDGNIYVADTADNEIRWLSAVHAGHIATPTGSEAMAAFSPTVTKSSVGVRFVLGRRASVTLIVRFRNRSTTVAHRTGFEGFGQIFWNRRLSGHPAPAGRYKLVVKASISHHSATSAVTVKF